MAATSNARTLLPSVLCLAGAATAVLVTGSEPLWAVVAFFALSGLALLIGRPIWRAGWWPVTLGAVFCILTAVSFLPASLFPEPSWRSVFSVGFPYALADSVNPQPWLGLFWWLLLAASALVGWYLLSTPLEGRSLALFLHFVAGFVALYAILSVADLQTKWDYPFRGGAVFGLLPNKNHTATLLVVGAIVSFGLMQWEIARGSRGAAVFAALCGATPLAALLFFSNSRAGVIFLVFGLFLWAAGAARGRARTSVLAGAIVLVVFLAVLFAAGGSEVRDRLQNLGRHALAVEQEGGGGQADLDFRQPIFRDTLRMIRDQPLVGAGLGQFQYIFPHYREESARAVRILHPESDWLMVAAESGVPAAFVLLALACWYAQRNWRHRAGTDGLLHWTAASAVLAAVAHGMVDVPWHRPALGWFLLVVAAATVPAASLPLRTAWFSRLFFVLAGVAMIAVTCWLAADQRARQELPTPYRWRVLTEQMTKLGREMRYEEALIMAREAVEIFPLDHESHYWLLGFSRGTDEDVDAITAWARRVEPVLPQVATGQAMLWKGVDDSREAEAWVEAIRRSMAIDPLETKRQSSAVSMVQQAMMNLAGKPNAQRVVLVEFARSPELMAAALRQADASLADEVLARLPDAAGWLDGLPPDLRGLVLDRWITLPSAAGAVAYMEARNAPEPGTYWRQLAEFYAKSGDKERAVGIVAQAEGVPPDGTIPQGDFAQELSGLQAQGNEVAVRRLMREAVEAKEPDAEKLRVAMAAYAGAGDWEMAWRAASRLVMEAKNRQ